MRIIKLFYGEYIVHLHCQLERRVIHTYTVYICSTQVYEYDIEYISFYSVFHSVPRFSNTHITFDQTDSHLNIVIWYRCIFSQTK